MSARILLSPPHLDDRATSLLLEAVASNWIAPLGPFVDRFEDALASLSHRRFALATCSGTAAIHLALLSLGVGEGDYVICQSLTFAGTVNPVSYVGGIPVFVDSERDTWNMDPDLTHEAIRWCLQRGRRPKAILVVHLYGMPARMDELLRLSEEYAIPLIEDAAEALGSRYRGEPCGAFGAASIFSFNGNKIITTSGGGALLSHDEPLIGRARHLATQARDAAPHYEHTKIGYNYRLSNLLAAVGCAQLDVLNDRVASRRAVYDWYCARLASSGCLTMQPEVAQAFSNRWLTAAVIADHVGDLEAAAIAARILGACATAQIDARPVWKPMHLQPVFRDAPSFGGTVSQSLFERGICLPSGSRLTAEELEGVGTAVSSVLA
jgi:dTDP-4-amino-4,6-dideoxygalactose transaminase